MVKSPTSDLEIPEIPIHQMVFQMMEAHSDRVAVVDGITEKSYTYREMLSIIRSIASGLKKLGLQQRDIVAFFSPNSPEYIFMFYATLACGATVTTINHVYTEYELYKHLEDSRPKFILASPETISTAIKANKQFGLTCIVSDGAYPNCNSLATLRADNGRAYPENVSINVKEDVAVIPYSSGTTGFPKGVMITHYNLVANVMQLSHPDFAMGPTSNPARQTVAVAFMPYFHAYGMVAMMIGLTLGGGMQLTLPRFELERFLQLIEKYKVTQLSLVPPIVTLLTNSPLVKKYDLSSVELAGSGAAPLSKESEERFQKMLKLPNMIQGYGMTEATLISTFPRAKDPQKHGSCGVPVPSCEMQVVNPSTKAILGPGERGEIWIRGPHVMKGYLNRPEATRETLDEHGWLHTGDIGYYDEDNYFYVVDRIKELIKYKGFQVAPAELESLLLNHPQIDDVAVIGVPDISAGELPRAYVVRKPGTYITEDDVKKYVADHLSSFKHLHGGVEFVTSVPKSQSGKILRRELRDRLKASKL